MYVVHGFLYERISRRRYSQRAMDNTSRRYEPFLPNWQGTETFSRFAPITKGIRVCRKTVVRLASVSTFPPMASNSAQGVECRIEIAGDTPIIREMQLRSLRGGRTTRYSLVLDARCLSAAHRVCGAGRSGRSMGLHLGCSVPLSAVRILDIT